MTAAPAPFQDAAQQARVAIALADQLDLGPKVFAASRRLLARADELDEQIRRGRVEATRQREQLQLDLMNGTGPLDPARLLRRGRNAAGRRASMGFRLPPVGEGDGRRAGATAAAPPALRLRYAGDHDWEPGLYLADDLVLPEPTQARRGLVGFLVPSPLRSAAERLGVS